MKYMLILRSTEQAAPPATPPSAEEYERSIETMSRFNEELVAAGVLLAMDGLDDDPAESVVVDHSATPPLVTDGPYGEVKELFAGFWILDVASRAEAVEWARRAPVAGIGSRIEVRRIASIDEFPQDNPWIQRERAWRERTGQL
ncbi:YciI family protein [Cellulomonas triticagri]|uniref:Transcription initiation protein n=1 Tax=Cellulomonas triticagri TaxID=2483352 RepID=A0A3M2JND0_9CELL|nr:YciI family protein [Cellulomonas triticagri]RMI13796.1 transcription initiation protein [Cellulomonas triticagri]